MIILYFLFSYIDKRFKKEREGEKKREQKKEREILYNIK